MLSVEVLDQSSEEIVIPSQNELDYTHSNIHQQSQGMIQSHSQQLLEPIPGIINQKIITDDLNLDNVAERQQLKKLIMYESNSNSRTRKSINKNRNKIDLREKSYSVLSSSTVLPKVHNKNSYTTTHLLTIQDLMTPQKHSSPKCYESQNQQLTKIINMNKEVLYCKQFDLPQSPRVLDDYESQLSHKQYQMPQFREKKLTSNKLSIILQNSSDIQRPSTNDKLIIICDEPQTKIEHDHIVSVQVKKPKEIEIKPFKGAILGDLWSVQQEQETQNIQQIYEKKELMSKQVLKNDNIALRMIHSPDKINRVVSKLQQVKNIKILISGWVYIEQGWLFSSWKKSYGILTDEKLILYEDESKKNVLNSFDFRFGKTYLKHLERNIIQIELLRYKLSITLKIEQVDKSAEWYLNLLQAGKSCIKEGINIKPKQIQKYFFQPTYTEREFLKMVNTGDMLLFQTDNISASLQRKFTDHVGLIIKFDDYDIRVFDTNLERGVSLEQWDIFIDENDLYSKVALRKLQYDKREDVQQKMLELIGETLGKKYLLNLKKLLNQSKTPTNEKPLTQSQEGFFCSEIVAKVYKRLGILPKSKTSSNYWPKHFSEQSQIQLLKGAKLGQEQIIILDRHRVQDENFFI